MTWFVEAKYVQYVHKYGGASSGTKIKKKQGSRNSWSLLMIVHDYILHKGYTYHHIIIPSDKHAAVL